MKLCQIAESITKGLPFWRLSLQEERYYYYDLNDNWFVQVNSKTESEIITYTLDLKLEDITADDWEVDTWEVVE